jgi:hypothetical protein
VAQVGSSALWFSQVTDRVSTTDIWVPGQGLSESAPHGTHD